jgi:hypothetical protein
MDIILLFNGLGNQLSQYAFLLGKRGLGQRVGAYYAFGGHNGYELDRIFDIHQESVWPMRCAKLLFRVCNSLRRLSKPLADVMLGLFRIRIVYESPDYRFDLELLRPWFGLRFFVGGWHDSRYFAGSETLVSDAFRFPELDERNQSVLRRIRSAHSVSIHIRRGDYLSGENLRLFGNIATIAYYRNAILEATAQAHGAGAKPRFFVFSDDMAWCRTALQLPDAEFVNINSGQDSWKDLALMSYCRINILANSTFSWWAAWLNQHPDKCIFCPTRFISTDQPGQSIYPSTWRQVAG